MMKPIHLFTLLIACLLAGCGSNAGRQGRIVSVTVEPQRFFAERIAGDRFTVQTVVPAGQSPETYDPSPQKMIEIGRSAAYLQIGHIGFEQAWIGNIRENNRQVAFFDLSEGMTLIRQEEEEHAGHRHPGGVDPHTWSSVKGARTIAANTLKAFLAIDPENEFYYKQNYDALLAEIDSTGRVIEQSLASLTNRTFIIYHPALTYFAAEYGLTQLCIETDGKEPSPLQMKQLVDTARRSSARVIFVQQEFNSRNAELVAKETGCRLVTIHPLSYHWPEEMIRIAKALSDE